MLLAWGMRVRPTTIFWRRFQEHGTWWSMPQREVRHGGTVFGHWCYHVNSLGFVLARLRCEVVKE